MIYSIKVLYENKTSVALVGAKDKKEAMQKVLVLYGPCEIHSVEIQEIPRDLLDGKLENYYKGGMVLAEFEDFGD